MREHPVAGSELDVRVVGPQAWALWRDGRLRALADTPSAFGSTYERELDFTTEDWRARLASESVSVLATVNGTVVALGGGFLPGDRWCHVFGMWVDPDWRRQGLSSRLLDVIVDWADARALRTRLDVTVGNDAARAAYESYGFVGTGEASPLRQGSSLLLERMVLPQRNES